MKNKRRNLIVIILVLVFLVVGIGVYSYSKYYNKIPNDYIAVFHSESGEITYTTYIYKIENGNANFGFKYINTTNTEVPPGSDNWEIKITDRGKVTWTDDVFKVAKNNGAYSYVKVPNDSKIYSIQEFMSRFIMD